jgi:Domain of unknown function (DUF4365)
VYLGRVRPAEFSRHTRALTHFDRTASFCPTAYENRVRTVNNWYWFGISEVEQNFMKKAEFKDVTGFRGEKIVELCLTDYQAFSKPLFRPGFLEGKWPAIDFYVELPAVRGKRLYFFVQAKATTSALAVHSSSLSISTKEKDIARLLQIPGPTYILGVHEPSKRVFVRSVHVGTPVKAITRIPLAYELTSANLRALHDEVRTYWMSHTHKPTSSRFA